MPFDVKALLHNKPALIGLGVAAAAGLYVLIKRKQTTGSSTSGAGVAGGQTPYTVPSSYPDTTSTDLVQQWGQFSQNLLSDLQNDFPGAGAANGGTGGISSTTPPPPTSSGTTVQTPSVSHTTVTDAKNLNELLNFFHISEAQFEQYNPGITATYAPYIAGKGYVNAGTPGAQTVLNVGPTPRVVNLPPGTPGGW